MFRRLITSSSLTKAIQPSTFKPIAVAQPVLRRAYHEKGISLLLDHYNRPRNVGSLPKSDPNVGTGLVGAPACGDVMKLQIRVDPETNEIVEVKFKTFGCGSAIASSSYLTEMVKGMNIDEAAKIKNTEIAKELCLPPVKLHCSMLAEDAIKSAVKDYRSKSKRAVPTIGEALAAESSGPTAQAASA